MCLVRTMDKIVLKIKDGYDTGVCEEIWSAPFALKTCQFSLTTTAAVQ